MKIEKVLVAGASGKTGEKVVNLLKDSDKYEPIAMVRTQKQKNEFEQRGVGARLGDLNGDVMNVADGVNKIIFAAGSGGKNVYDIDQEGAKKLVDAGKKARIDKFIMLSSMGVENPERSKELEDYFRAKKNADEYLSTSLLPYTILRPGALTNDAGTGMISAESKLENSGSVSRDDVAKTLCASLDMDYASDTSFEILSGKTQIEEAVESI